MTTPASLLHPDAFLSPLAIDEAVQRALDEDLGRAGDITSMATIPETTHAHAIMVARQSGVIAGLPLAVAVFQKLSPDISIEAHVRDGAAVAAGVHLLTISGPARAVLARRAHRAEFCRPAFRRRHPHRRLCPPHRRHQDAHLLHPQDHAGPARAGEIRGALRRRLQPSLRARRRDPDQGQPHRGRRRRHGRCSARAVADRASGQDRDRGRYARAIARGARYRVGRRGAARQYGYRRPDRSGRHGRGAAWCWKLPAASRRVRSRRSPRPAWTMPRPAR